MKTIDDLIQLFIKHGDSEYGGEAVTQIEHALQSALLAEQEGAGPELIVAALLHDVGHLLHELPEDAPERGIDDHHEKSAGHFLKGLFPSVVTEPVRLHVSAKRYLCAVDPDYIATLSQPSVISLNLQGGPMSADEVRVFEANPHHVAAVRLRRWDDAAKDPELKTPDLSYFEKYLRQVATAEEFV